MSEDDASIWRLLPWPSRVLVIAGGAFFLFAVGTAIADFPSSEGVDSLASAGLRGDFWGGHIGGISAAAGLMFTAAAIFLQGRELAAQLDEMRKSNNAQEEQAAATSRLLEATTRSNQLVELELIGRQRERRFDLASKLPDLLNSAMSVGGDHLKRAEAVRCAKLLVFFGADRLIEVEALNAITQAHRSYNTLLKSDRMEAEKKVKFSMDLVQELLQLEFDQTCVGEIEILGSKSCS